MWGRSSLSHILHGVGARRWPSALPMASRRWSRRSQVAKLVPRPAPPGVDPSVFHLLHHTLRQSLARVAPSVLTMCVCRCGGVRAQLSDVLHCCVLGMLAQSRNSDPRPPMMSAAQNGVGRRIRDGRLRGRRSSVDLPCSRCVHSPQPRRSCAAPWPPAKERRQEEPQQRNAVGLNLREWSMGSACPDLGGVWRST